MKRAKATSYVAGLDWRTALGIPESRTVSWSEHLKHIVEHTSRALRDRGLDPDLGPVRGDQQHLLVPYQQPYVRECLEAHRLARLALLDAQHSLVGFQLAQVWNGQTLAAVSAPALLAQSRSRMLQKRGRRTANEQRRETADQAVLRGFSTWQQRVKQALRGPDGRWLDDAARVKKYLATQRHLPDRERRRIRALAKVGKIPAP